MGKTYTSVLEMVEDLSDKETVDRFKHWQDNSQIGRALHIARIVKNEDWEKDVAKRIGWTEEQIASFEGHTFDYEILVKDLVLYAQAAKINIHILNRADMPTATINIDAIDTEDWDKSFSYDEEGKHKKQEVIDDSFKHWEQNSKIGYALQLERVRMQKDTEKDVAKRIGWTEDETMQFEMNVFDYEMLVKDLILYAQAANLNVHIITEPDATTAKIDIDDLDMDNWNKSFNYNEGISL